MKNIYPKILNTKHRVYPSSPRKGGGFTLIEVLVVLGIFLILGVIIINVFILTLRSQQQTSSRQKTLATLRYVTEIITRQVRTSEIDYSHYTNGIPDVPEDELALRDQLNRELIYYFDSGSGEIRLSIKESGAATAEVAPLIRPEEIKIVRLSFYITPSTDPFVEEQCSDDSDCYDSNLGCSLSKLCIGGADDGRECTSNSDCTGGSCQPPPFAAGFCICGTIMAGPDNDKCNITKNCRKDERLNKYLCLPPEYQPKVTMILGFESAGVRIEDRKLIYLQTTASSRIYKR